MRYTNAQINQQRIKISSSDDNYDLAMFWTLRAILNLKFFDNYFDGSDLQKNKLEDLIYRIKEDFAEKFPKNLKLLRCFFNDNYKKIQSKKEIKSSKILAQNIKSLTALLPLNNTEQWILVFAILSEQFSFLEELIDLCCEIDISNFDSILSIILMQEKEAIQKALDTNSILYSTGILIKYYNNYQNKYFGFGIDSFSKMMITQKCNTLDIFKNSFFKTSAGHLGLQDFEHIKSFNDPLLKYLKNALKRKQKGCNILIYGAAGTGKTEYAKLLASVLNCENYEISFVSDRHYSLTNSKRFKSYLLANEVLKNTNSLILFDEIEDLFQNHNSLNSDDTISKALFNKTLESNNRPTIWLSNSINMLDCAYIRRFDFVYEMPNPPRFKRGEILKQHFGDLISKNDIENLSQYAFISPAILTRTSKVLHSIDEKQITSKTSFLMINETLKAQGYPQISPNPTFNTTIYDTSFVNTDVNLSQVLEGIKRTENARVCLFGKPGTGKSEYCKYIARELDKPIYIKKASDILSPYVGKAEKNMAEVFGEAKEDGAVLVFDEVDSFLQDRNNATKSWEISLVNEMLTQMESYNGIFFATTNLSKSLDSAALRRFDMKLEFNYLNEKQSLELLKRHLKELNLKGFNKDHEARITSLKNLTAGDFHAIRRQMNFYPTTSIDAVINLLEKECEIKEKSSFKMGFLS